MLDLGILIASDKQGEWLLPWWWEGYASHNQLPVAFVDFGMTGKARSWCKSRGMVIDLQDAQEHDPLPYELQEAWVKTYGSSYLSCRAAWLKKPLACQASPFQKTIWIDIDCEILAPIEDAFSYLDKECALWYGSSLSVPANLQEVADAGFLCNSGVIVFTSKCFLIEQWVKKTREEASHYFGDECILSSLLYQHPDRVSWLPEEYNWRICRGVPVQAKIIHWKGEWGKQYIAAYGGLRPLLQKSVLL